jgi:AraC-like DNA-binding protein
MELTKKKSKCKIKQKRGVIHMPNSFDISQIHHVTEANINYYATPFVHPRRNMNEHDFILMLDGEWKIGQDDTSYDLKKNTLLILSAGHTHYGISHCSPGTRTMYFHVSCNPGDIFIPDENQQQYPCIITQTILQTDHTKEIRELFSQVVNSKLSGHDRQSDLYFELLLCAISAADNPNVRADITQKLLNIIHSSPEKNFSNKELAEMINVSTKTAETKFKAVTGKTIHQYILDYKIKQAISTFNLFPDISICQTALNLGFYDEYHFSKQFKRITGLSPTQYKREHFSGGRNETI